LSSASDATISHAKATQAFIELVKPLSQSLAIHEFEARWDEWSDVGVFHHIRRKVGCRCQYPLRRREIAAPGRTIETPRGPLFIPDPPTVELTLNDRGSKRNYAENSIMVGYDTSLNPFDRWDADMRRYLSKCPSDAAAALINGLRHIWRRYEAGPIRVTGEVLSIVMSHYR
jgi:hypothetical protein